MVLPESLTLMTPFLGQPAVFWAGFFVIVVGLLILDLFVFNTKDKIPSTRASVIQALSYFALAMCFGVFVWQTNGPEHGMDFYTGYMIELSLSMDNLFVMSVILTTFAVPTAYQHRVLFWGILGVLVLRGIMIGFGTALIAQFEWVLYIFALFLIITGVRLLAAQKDQTHDVRESFIVTFLQRHVRFTARIHGHAFWVREPHPQTGKMVLFATPLFMALMCIELMDVVFALDSIPAIFAISTEPFVVYTSNIFAILGLRALYFALASVIERFRYMKYALSIVLIFIGTKVFYTHFVGKIDPLISLSVTIGILAAGVLFSLRKTASQT